ncbi:helix-turn-helix protein [Muricomes intestini]|uniref:Helix-turn-helix protein n=1 Tax=Muricomes intestini TaxID=1796634 RepID=A0A4R3K350_9FIRM|nr:helix-turn-helix transcriptional regulator [Muricomes intestini]TCS77099.1 helix-turn-helix protein [Muricomes intestini]
MNTGERIKQARKQAKLSQGQLGKRVGISQQQIAQYENRVRNPKIETLKKIANALNVTPAEFLEDELFDATDFPDESGELSLMDKKLEGILNDEKDGMGIDMIKIYFDMLNKKGQLKAIEQVELLSRIPEYQKSNHSLARPAR